MLGKFLMLNGVGCLIGTVLFLRLGWARGREVSR